MGMGLFIGIWVARYLGPIQYGLLNFSLAIIALLGSVASLGLNGIVVRDLIENSDTNNTTLGTAFVLQLIGGLLAFVFAVIFIIFARANDETAKYIVVVLSFMLVFRATDTVKYWFEAHVLSKYVVWVENAVFLVIVLVKVGLILFHASLMSFVWVFLTEAMLNAFSLLMIYARKVGKLNQWKFSLSRAKILLLESWPMILASIAAMINMRVDQVMLGTMRDDIIVGNYSAAVRISEIWLVIPGILGASIFPAMVNAKQQSEELYLNRARRTISLMAVFVIPVSLFVSMYARYISHMLFGENYTTAGNYLSILIWSGVPYMIFFVITQMIYIERLVKLSAYVAIFSIVVNITLNSLLIPTYGGVGAAISTVIAACGAVLFSLITINAKTGVFGRPRL